MHNHTWMLRYWWQEQKISIIDHLASQSSQNKSEPLFEKETQIGGANHKNSP